MASTITRESVGHKRLLFLWNNIKDFISEVLKKGFQISAELLSISGSTTELQHSDFSSFEKSTIS